MKGSIALMGVPVLAALAGTPAYAAGPAPFADLRMAYGNPEIAKDHSGVTWHWTLTNAGAAGAVTVVATHKVSADQKIVGVSQPCANTGGDVVCQFGEIKPGERRTGWIRTTVAKPGGTLRVNAQVTWHESPSAAPGIGDPSVVDAGRPASLASPVSPMSPASPASPASPSSPANPGNIGLGGPAAGSPHGESWGVSDTDATTDMPARTG